MPQVGFKCPDGFLVSHEECMAGCRIANSFKCKRCLPMPFLASCIQDRRPGNVFSVTTLQKPTIQTVLAMNNDYYVEPIARYNLVRGSMSHWMLENAMAKIPKDKSDLHIYEKRMACDLFSGQIDYYDGEDQILFDYKFVNSGKAFKMRKDVVKHAYDYVMQINMYRYLLQSVENLRVKDMYLYAFAYNAPYNGTGKTPLISQIPIPFISDATIMNFANSRVNDITSYADMYPTKLPPACEETWDGKRCHFYCEVSDFCPFKQELKEKKTKEEADDSD